MCEGPLSRIQRSTNDRFFERFDKPESDTLASEAFNTYCQADFLWPTDQTAPKPFMNKWQNPSFFGASIQFYDWHLSTLNGGD